MFAPPLRRNYVDSSLFIGLVVSPAAHRDGEISEPEMLEWKRNKNETTFLCLLMSRGLDEAVNVDDSILKSELCDHFSVFKADL